MEDTILIPVEASLSNPGDPTEVTLVADVSGVGITKRTSTGTILNWTPEMLKKAAPSLRGRPVNVLLTPDGEGVTGHTHNAIGTIIDAKFDEATQKLRVFASLWRHYFPETITKLGELFKKGLLQVSAEFAVADHTEESGITTPTEGFFTGLGIVSDGADPQNRVLVLASALKVDQEAISNMEPQTTVEVKPGSFEWAGEQIANFISNTTSTGDTITVTGTYPDAFYYSDGSNEYRVPITTTSNGGTYTLKFSEPVIYDGAEDTSTIVWGNAPEELEDMPTVEELAAAEASRDAAKAEADDWKTKFENLEAEVKEERESREADKRANDRMAEIEKITPYTDQALRTEHLELFKTADDKLFEAMKNLILATVQPKGGISSEAGVPANDDIDPSLAEAQKNKDAWREEMLAAYPKPQGVTDA